MGSISPQSYESAAKECYDLSKKFQTVYNAMQSILLETSAMAGGYQAVKIWSTAYDSRAGAMTMVATNFARALQHFGDVLTAAGYNWKCAEYKANRDPSKGAPPSLPSGFPSELPYGPGIVTGVASSGTYSNGLETDWTELQNKVTALTSGGEIPDGDTDKLARAATAWKTFTNSDPVYSGAGRLRIVVGDGLKLGYGSNTRDIPNLVGHLRTLADVCSAIEAAARDIAAAVDTHQVALAKMRYDMNTQYTIVAVVTAIQIGRSMVRVKEPPNKQKDRPKKEPGSDPDDIDLLDDLARAIAGPANTFLTALGGFNFSTAALTNGELLTIAGLPILLTEITEGGDTRKGSPNNSNTPGNPEYDARLQELAKDPAHGGNTTPKTLREAEVALAMERNGQLKPPVTRAQMVNGQDTGDFVDGSGVHWDMKQPTDTFPPTAGPNAGQPMPPTMKGVYNEAIFEQNVIEELNSGENVFIDPQNLSAAGLQSVQSVISRHPEWAGKVIVYGK
ncbi:hypothetical protein [Nocardia colli]|uniref:hypothetical protein n=1 Tax=Nocardia colli TaxID=2545717 RepID=UPI0035D8B4CE